MSGSGTVCPWCSGVLTAGAATCPGCGAALTADPDLQVPGITNVTAAARPRRRPRRGLLGLLLGGTELESDEPAAGPRDA